MSGSVVKRPALASTCFEPQVGEGPQTSPSHVTLLKAQAANLYYHEHLMQFVKSKEIREQNRQKLIQSGLPPEQLDQLLRKFDDQESEVTRANRSRLKPDRFERIALIGKGGFGHVWLVNDTCTGNKYALKVLRKADIIQTEQVINVRTERDILALSNNPWIANLVFSFQDQNHLYLVLEFVQGGDLMNLLIKRIILTEAEAKFYCGEIALALRSLHERGLVHFDLKPDNILISSNGHIKLTDFGLATYYCRSDGRFQNLFSEMQDYLNHPEWTGSTDKKHRDRAQLVATCDYTAPEVIAAGNSRVTSTSADWWSFGVILYEMLCGYTPFYAESAQLTTVNVLNWRETLRFPPGKLSREARDLLGHLLCSVESRWGYDEVINCAFFRTARGSAPFNFAEPENNRPPLIPKIQNETDTSFFDVMELDEDPLPEVPLSQELAKFAFLGFTFKKDQRPANVFY